MRRKAGNIVDIGEVANTGIKNLRRIWLGAGFGDPPRLRRRLLAGLLAYKLQERSRGALPPATARRLREIAGDTGGEPNLSHLMELRIKPGTRLQRVWKNELHEAIALETGFAYRGQTYGSLSVIARAITGSRWSGPAFFGLKAAAGDRP